MKTKRHETAYVAGNNNNNNISKYAYITIGKSGGSQNLNYIPASKGPKLYFIPIFNGAIVNTVLIIFMTLTKT